MTTKYWVTGCTHVGWMNLFYLNQPSTFYFTWSNFHSRILKIFLYFCLRKATGLFLWLTWLRRWMVINRGNSFKSQDVGCEGTRFFVVLLHLMANCRPHDENKKRDVIWSFILSLRPHTSYYIIISRLIIAKPAKVWIRNKGSFTKRKGTLRVQIQFNVRNATVTSKQPFPWSIPGSSLEVNVQPCDTKANKQTATCCTFWTWTWGKNRHWSFTNFLATEYWRVGKQHLVSDRVKYRK